MITCGKKISFKFLLTKDRPTFAEIKSSCVSGRFLARIAARHTPRKAFSFPMGQDRSMGRHRDEGEPRAFSGITLWQAADVHPCSRPYLHSLFRPRRSSSDPPSRRPSHSSAYSFSILWTHRPRDPETLYIYYKASIGE